MENIEIVKETYLDLTNSKYLTDYNIVKIYDENIIIKDSNGLLGMLNLNSKLLSVQIVVEPNFNELEEKTPGIFEAADYQEYYYFDKNGKLLLTVDKNTTIEIEHTFNNNDVLFYNCHNELFYLYSEGQIKKLDQKISIIDEENWIRYIPQSKGRIENRFTHAGIDIDFHYDNVSFNNNDIGITKLNEKYGLISKLGEEILKPTYDYIFPFEGEVARVKIASRFGLIDRNGYEIVNTKEKDYFDMSEFSDGLATYRGPYPGKIGIINKQGIETSTADFAEIDPFHNGVAPATTWFWNNTVLINKNGKLILKSHFGSLKYYKDGLYFFKEPDPFDDGAIGLINQDGEVIIKPLDKLNKIDDNIMEYKHLQLAPNIDLSYHGLINDTGKVIFCKSKKNECWPLKVLEFENDQFQYIIKDNIIVIYDYEFKKYIVFDNQGNIIIPYIDLQSIHIFNKDYLIINNCLISINDLKIIYKITIKYKEKLYEQYFDNEMDSFKAIENYCSKKNKLLLKFKNIFSEIDERDKYANKKLVKF